MRLPRDLSGRDLANHLIRHWGFREERQTGSHIILRMQHPVRYTISVPAHKQLRLGTLRDLVSSIAEKKGCSVEELLEKL